MTTMKITIEIHDGWLGRPEDLREILATIAGLECPPSSRDEGRGMRDESDPAGPAATHPSSFIPHPSQEGPPRGRNGRYSGDDDRSQASRDDEEEGDDEDPPTNGRQLLGWCAKQVPDAKGKVIGYGKKRGFPGRVVDWKPDQVDAAYRFARSRPSQSRR
jgi:hypothetical protein